MMAKKYIASYQNELARERQAREKIVPTVKVYVANRALRYGEELKKEDVKTVLWPVNAIPEGAFKADSDLFPEDTKDNRVVLRAMEKDEAILAVKITEPGKDAGIAWQLEKGTRAFAIKVDVASGVSGFLRPGDRVDIYWTGRVHGANRSQSELTRLIEPGIQIIAIDQSAGSDLEGTLIARTVTVAGRPEQVAALNHGQNTGRLSLSLVGAADDTMAGSIEVNQQSLLGIDPLQEEVAVQEEKKVCTIRNRRGAEVIEIPIPCTN